MRRSSPLTVAGQRGLRTPFPLGPELMGPDRAVADTAARIRSQQQRHVQSGPDAAIAVAMQHPVEVRRLAAEHQLQITWNDGHVSCYPFEYLRGWCPCAACQGHSGEHHYVSGQNTELTKIAVVGRYALSLAWGDGHYTGIYSYRYLREICPCPTCNPQQS